ncbi:hypothetical protein D4L85_14370 [Chryseolinea soli]|uniref:Uncharacterized protein n=1 Tax=Chryseolinea soli TaxID=2321403 RepID=A0A385SP07_9BACT|nr:hypothetical protein D4L85_14370 [Chryseolinea soli]
MRYVDKFVFVTWCRLLGNATGGEGFWMMLNYLAFKFAEVLQVSDKGECESEDDTSSLFFSSRSHSNSNRAPSDLPSKIVLKKTE